MSIDLGVKEGFKRVVDVSMSSLVEKMMKIYIDENKKMTKRVENRVRRLAKKK